MRIQRESARHRRRHVLLALAGVLAVAALSFALFVVTAVLTASTYPPREPQREGAFDPQRLVAR